MELVDNKHRIDQDVVEAVEEALVEYLEPVKKYEEISLAELYKVLGVRFTTNRTGGLDKLILHTMLTWNWRMIERGHDRSLISFERRRHQTGTRSIRFANGDFLFTTLSYPPQRSDEADTRSDVVRARINAARKARSLAERETVE
ncbi:MAG: hypothetical protein AAGD04_08315 [Pseudomonadota bacterium]